MNQATAPAYRILSARERTRSGWLTQRLDSSTRIAYDPDHVAGVICPTGSEWCSSPHVVAIEDATPVGTIGARIETAPPSGGGWGSGTSSATTTRAYS